jgi:hypothetical protein
LRICKWQIAEEEKELNRLRGLLIEREIAAALQRGLAGEAPSIDDLMQPSVIEQIATD